MWRNCAQPASYGPSRRAHLGQNARSPVAVSVEYCPLPPVMPAKDLSNLYGHKPNCAITALRDSPQVVDQEPVQEAAQLSRLGCASASDAPLPANPSP